jgi:hypothetical protein
MKLIAMHCIKAIFALGLRIMKRITSSIYILFISLIFLSACSTKNNAFRDQYRWLSGKWEGEDKGTIMFENWKWEKHRFEGTAAEIVMNDTVFSEHLFIEQFDNEAAYIVVMKERSPILFHQIEDEMGRLVFVNEANDFPAKIIYQQDSENSLTISLMAKGRPNQAEVSYQMTRMK